MQNRVKAIAASHFQNKSLHTTLWQLTHPAAKFLSQIGQTYSFKFRDSADRNKDRNWLQKIREDNQA